MIKVDASANAPEIDDVRRTQPRKRQLRLQAQ